MATPNISPSKYTSTLVSVLVLRNEGAFSVQGQPVNVASVADDGDGNLLITLTQPVPRVKIQPATVAHSGTAVTTVMNPCAYRYATDAEDNVLSFTLESGEGFDYYSLFSVDTTW